MSSVYKVFCVTHSPAIIVLLFAMVFAGAGIDIQYYQAGDDQ